MKIFSRLFTAGVITLGGFIFLVVTILAAINNWGAFKYDEDFYDDFIDMEG